MHTFSHPTLLVSCKIPDICGDLCRPAVWANPRIRPAQCLLLQLSSNFYDMNDTSTINGVPLLDLKAQYEGIRDEVKAEIEKVLDSQSFVLGPAVDQFENEVGQYIGTPNAIGCASGSDSLLLALMAIDLQPGDLVLTSPYTFFATGGAIARLGGIPVFTDINPDDYNLNADLVEQFLTGDHPLSRRFKDHKKRIKAIIPVHLYGQCADMAHLTEIAVRHDVDLIEDTAQAIGSKFKGRTAGTMGDFGCFSFFPSKNLGGYGDGGLISTDNSEYADKLRILRVHGSKPKYHHKVVGINSRLDSLQAAVLSVKLRHLEDWHTARREKAIKYNQLFEEAGIRLNDQVQRPSDINDVVDSNIDKLLTPVEVSGKPESGGRHVYHQYVIRTLRRDELKNALDSAGIGNAIYYPVPLHEQECFTYLGYQDIDCPNASAAGRQTLALPIYPELTDDQQEYIVAHIVKALK